LEQVRGARGGGDVNTNCEWIECAHWRVRQAETEERVRECELADALRAAPRSTDVDTPGSAVEPAAEHDVAVEGSILTTRKAGTSPGLETKGANESVFEVSGERGLGMRFRSVTPTSAGESKSNVPTW
jgi:hypothetical protein